MQLYICTYITCFLQRFFIVFLFASIIWVTILLKQYSGTIVYIPELYNEWLHNSDTQRNKGRVPKTIVLFL